MSGGNDDPKAGPRTPADARPLTEGELLYETDRSVAEYLEFHWGPEHLGVPNFPAACARASVAALLRARHVERARCLDVGCAVGRSSFELATHFRQVDAIDFSHHFIDAASRLARDGRIAWQVPTEGRLTADRTASLESILREDAAQAGPAASSKELVDRIRFQQGDACALAADLTGYDLVLAANLIDRLHDPAAFLGDIAHRIVPGGVLAITSPYTWLESYTAPDKWLGGRLVEGRPVTTVQGIARVLAGDFEPIDRRDIPFVIRETARKHQYTIAEFTAWRRV